MSIAVDSQVLLDSSVTHVQGIGADARPFWYAIRARPHCEKVVSCALRAKGYDEFLPQYCRRSQWSDRVKEVDVPLFPGYVFCRSITGGRPLLVTTPGVIEILKFGTEFALISDAEIEAVKAVLRSGACIEPWPYLREGHWCRVMRGPLSGLEGIFIQKKKAYRVVLSVEALCRSIAVEIDQVSVTPIASPSNLAASNWRSFQKRVF